MSIDFGIQTQKFLNEFVGSQLQLDGAIGVKSKEAITIAIQKLKNIYRKLNYEWLDVNLIGFRELSIFDNLASDWFVYVAGTTLYAVPCSTRAGNYWVYNPITDGGITGTAIMAKGQWKNCWTFINSSNWSNLWLGAPYFYQTSPIKIWRDGNRNNIVDRIMEQFGLFGINIHHSGWSFIIDNWSAGCIVIPYKYFLELVPLFVAGQKYSFTLLEKEDV